MKTSLSTLFAIALMLAGSTDAAAGDCCTPKATPGCLVTPIETCVCDQDSYCCESEWDETCVSEVDSFGCGNCGTASPCGNGDCDFGEDCGSCPEDCGPCGGSCGDLTCDPDEDCNSCPEDCGPCSGSCGDTSCSDDESCYSCPQDCGDCSGQCCEANNTPGCEDYQTTACVCEQDNWCCTSDWDQTCVSEVDSFGCGACGGQPTCGDGDCTADEDCQTCPEDCGACPEDCGYCSQSAGNDAEIEPERLLPIDEVLASATAAREKGATRFCMGAAWRNPTDTNLQKVANMVRAVKDMGMETCLTLGMLTADQASKLKDAGLDYYNHNLDTSPEFYGEVITTRTYEDRLQTLDHVRQAGLNVCSGGILGMGESRRDRASMLRQLSNLPSLNTTGIKLNWRITTRSGVKRHR